VKAGLIKHPMRAEPHASCSSRTWVPMVAKLSYLIQRLESVIKGLMTSVNRPSCYCEIQEVIFYKMRVKPGHFTDFFNCRELSSTKNIGRQRIAISNRVLCKFRYCPDLHGGSGGKWQYCAEEKRKLFSRMSHDPTIYASFWISILWYCM
jgi:hypothetical protein